MKRPETETILGFISVVAIVIAAGGFLAYWKPEPVVNARDCTYLGIKAKPEEILAACDRALRRDVPDEMRALYLGIRGEAYFVLRQFDAALDNYNQALELKPELLRAKFTRATIYFEKREYDRAMADFDAILRVNPKAISALAGRARIYGARRQFALAVTALDEVVKQQPDDAPALANRGNFLLALGEIERSIADLSKAHSLAPKQPAPLANRGIAYTYAGQFDRALADEDEAIRLAPNVPNGYRIRCFTRAVENKQLDHALGDCNKAISLSPDDTPYRRGFVYLRQERYAEALRDFDAIFAREPGSASSFYGRSIARRHTGDVAGARADLTIANEDSPKIVALLAGLGFK